MALTEETISLNLLDKVGDLFDARRTKAWVTTSADVVHDTLGHATRVGTGKGTVGTDGIVTWDVWTPGTGSNPASWQTTFHVSYPDRDARDGRTTLSFGPYTVTAAAWIDELDEEQAVPPTYLTTVTTELQTYVDAGSAASTSAAASATSAAASAALAEDISNIDTPDALVATLVGDSGSDTATALSATIAAEGNELFGPVVTPEAYGAVGDGATNDAPAIQSMFDALAAGGVPRFVRFREGADYYLAGEVEVNADFVSVQAHGAQFTGPVAGTPEGGLITIVDRSDLTRAISHVSWSGGHFVTNHVGDNGLNVVAAEDWLISNVSTDVTVGLRGIAVQTNASYTAPLRRGQIVACSSTGGTNGLDIESVGVDTISDISVRGFRVEGAAVGLRCSAGGAANVLTRIIVDGLETVDCAGGIFWHHCADSRISGFDLAGVTGRGIDSQYATGSIRNGRIEGTAATDIAISVTNGTGLHLSQIAIGGTFTHGLYSAATDITARDFTIKDCAVGIQTNSATQRSVYSDFVFENVTTEVSNYRAGDTYRAFTERTGTTTTDISRHGQSAIDVPVFGYYTQTNFSSLASKGLVSTGAQNATISWKITPGAGTYTLRLGHTKSSNRGIYTVTVDGVSVGTIDGYDAATADALSELTGIALTNGEHTLTLTMATKNASASSYYGSVFAIALARTA